MNKWLKKHLPTKEKINQDASMSFLHKYLTHTNTWHFNPESTSRAVAVGLFIAFIPLPMQMILAAVFAIIFRANLPLAIAMTWVTNPFTFVPINYFIYWVGKTILHETITNGAPTVFAWHFESFSAFWASFSLHLAQWGKAFLVGLPIVAISVSLLGYCIVKVIWYLGFNRKKSSSHS